MNSSFVKTTVPTMKPVHRTACYPPFTTTERDRLAAVVRYVAHGLGAAPANVQEGKALVHESGI
jgi:hypothetical protein